MTDGIPLGTRIVYDRDGGRGEAIVRESGLDDWERWYRAEDVETGQDVMIGESSVITTRSEKGDN